MLACRQLQTQGCPLNFQCVCLHIELNMERFPVFCPYLRCVTIVVQYVYHEAALLFAVAAASTEVIVTIFE
jgi:hypothetical protein